MTYPQNGPGMGPNNGPFGNGPANNRRAQRPNRNNATNGDKPPFYKRAWFWIVLALVVFLIGSGVSQINGPKTIDTQNGLELLEQNQSVQVTSSTMTEGDQSVDLKLTGDYVTKVNGKSHNYGSRVRFYYTSGQAVQVARAVEAAAKNHSNYRFNSVVPQNSMMTLFIGSVLPLILIFLIFWWSMRSLRGQGGGLLGMGDNGNNGRVPESEIPDTKFSDVAGEDEAVAEVQEIKDFLKDPQKYRRLGARIPRGVLLYGQPGTGKTLLARAIAGEAGVPFYAIAGSDFVEMFVGLGASRVRDLFDEAKKHAPSIIFIDEIDAVGRRRGSGMSGGHDEREQTLNQLLVEMDGFNNDTGVIVIAATNRPDVLDPALLRAGRFDRQVGVSAPDLEGREAILRVHAKGKPFVPDVDLHTVAVRTPGFTGADLANVLNEAALLTARSNAQLIDNRALDEAIDRVFEGPRRQTRGMALTELRNTAYHEGGHALVAAALHHTDPVTKVTILPRGRALGYTAVMPTRDRYSETRDQLLDQMAYAMGGRTAEEIVFHDPSTGASNDIEKATQIARKMVLEYGFSAKLGAVKWASADNDNDSMDDIAPHPYSDETQNLIDHEVRSLVEHAHQEAYDILMQNRDVLDELVTHLLEKETLNEKELKEVFAGITKAPERREWLSDPNRPLPDRAPVPIPESLRRSVMGHEAHASGQNSQPAQGNPAPGDPQGRPGRQSR